MYIKSLLLYFFSSAALAAPWFTGPLLAPAGRTIPTGHFNFEPYSFYTDYAGGFRNYELTPIMTAGLNSFMDVQASLPYDNSWLKSQHGDGFGDFNIGLGFQLFTQKEGSLMPDLRIVVQETIPTGRYDLLNPQKNLTDQTGMGSYQSMLSFNSQKLFVFKNEHYLRGRLSVSITSPNSVYVQGLNTYGGNPATEGRVYPGDNYAVDLASEFTLTQNWVVVMEGLYVHSNSTRFRGNPGILSDGTKGSVGGSSSESASLAPALEYNFSSHLGIIGGVWFSVTGPHAAKFTSITVAVNYYFP
ncbi:MAG: transporter [Tatlockia sp.]|nr:transporter [Tatlockia sp.]